MSTLGSMGTAFVIFIGLIIAAVAIDGLLQVPKATCPHCIHDEEEKTPLIAISRFFWFCFTCGATFGYADAMRARDYEDE